MDTGEEKEREVCISPLFFFLRFRTLSSRLGLSIQTEPGPVNLRLCPFVTTFDAFSCLPRSLIDGSSTSSSSSSTFSRLPSDRSFLSSRVQKGRRVREKKKRRRRRIRYPLVSDNYRVCYPLRRRGKSERERVRGGGGWQQGEKG